MKAVILAAGEGTRMRPLTANLPKPLLPVAGKPFLLHTLEAVRQAGVREVTLLVGWQGHRIRERFGRGDAFVASLDHTVWFHRPFRADEWWLYDQVSPSASGGRGLVLARVFTQDGQLVASVAQEAVLRPRKAAAPKEAT